MKINTYLFNAEWNKSFNVSLDSETTLIIVFSSLDAKQVQEPLAELRNQFPQSLIIGASSAGQFLNDEISDDVISVTVIKFEHTQLKITAVPIKEGKSFDDGIKATLDLRQDDLKSIFILSDGLMTNGSQLTKGINSVLPKNVTVTGGLAADKDRFEHTWVLVDGKPKQGYLTMVGFYGDHLHISHGSNAGWEKLGLGRRVTKSCNNVLYELDGRPALELYKSYLGKLADGLPATGLLFPLEISEEGSPDQTKIRTILGVNEEDNSIIFAGDIPEGSYATLMNANVDRLIDGSVVAAQKLNFRNNHDETTLVIAISCVGRRLVLKQRTEEELECNLEIFPKNAQQIGFYSYGEISSNQAEAGQCDLFNQTMTLTALWESNA